MNKDPIKRNDEIINLMWLACFIALVYCFIFSMIISEVVGPISPDDFSHKSLEGERESVFRSTLLISLWK